MKLMVAGCSYSAPSQTLPGTAWSEVMSQRLGWDLVNLARQGCSNGGVRVQIEEIRRQRPDFAIITPTFWDRMEIPASAAPYQPSDSEDKGRGWGGRGSDLQRHLQNTQLKNGYDRAAGIDNVNYGNNPYRMICETIFSLAENYPHQYRSQKISHDAQTAVKHYINNLYDSEWKKQQDEWIIREGIMQLHLDGINFIVVPILLWPFDPANQTQWRTAFPSMIPDRNIMLNEKQSYLPISARHEHVGQDPGYHMAPSGQVEIAENFLQRMRDDFGLN
jgi:hypothetical protein